MANNIFKTIINLTSIYYNNKTLILIKCSRKNKISQFPKKNYSFIWIGKRTFTVNRSNLLKKRLINKKSLLKVWKKPFRESFQNMISIFRKFNFRMKSINSNSSRWSPLTKKIDMIKVSIKTKSTLLIFKVSSISQKYQKIIFSYQIKMIMLLH